MTHHIDDGLLVADKEVGEKIILEMAGHLLLKVSDPIWPGDAVDHLNRRKVRINDGWITIPDAKHLENAITMVGYDERPPGKPVATPGVRRSGLSADDETLLGEDQTKRFGLGWVAGLL